MLALVAGMGFVVGGTLPLAPPEAAVARFGADAVRSVAEALATVARPSPGLALSGIVVRGLDDTRSRGGRSHGSASVARRPAFGAFDALRFRTAATPRPSPRPGFARDALARAGRLQSPTTAPPLLTS